MVNAHGAIALTVAGIEYDLLLDLRSAPRGIPATAKAVRAPANTFRGVFFAALSDLILGDKRVVVHNLRAVIPS